MVSNIRLFDEKPQSITTCVCSVSEIQRSVKVSIARVSTVQALEKTSLFRSDGKYLMASVACFGRVGGRNNHKDNTISGRLIFYEVPQLEERPVMQKPIQFLSFSSCSYATQVFHDDNITCFASADNTLADFMVDTPHKPCLSTTHLHKMLLGRLRAFALEFAPQPLKSCNMIFDTFEKLPIGCGSEIVNAEVNSDNLIVQAKSARTDLFSNNHIKENIFTISTQDGTTDIPITIGFKIIQRDKKFAFISSFECRKRAFARKIKGIRTLVVLDGKFLGEVYPTISASSFGFQSVFYGFARQLRRQFESCSEVFVEMLVQGFPRAYLLSQSIIIGVLCGFGELLHSSDERRRRFDLHFHGSLNNHVIPYVRMDIKNYRQFLPPLKSVGFLADFER